MTLDFANVVGMVTGLLVIGGIGWKLASELGGIKTSLTTIITTYSMKHDMIDKDITLLTRRIEKLEDLNTENLKNSAK